MSSANIVPAKKMEQDAKSTDRIKELHPCFGARRNRGRIHLPVCPKCNIQCRFCDRKINDYENRPGVASSIVSPAEAAGYVEKALEVCPEISVIGIAGPGDTLADDNALETFKAVGHKFPNLLKCMSTNGLLLYERAAEVIEAGVDTLTVTINGVDPQIVAQIVSGIVFHGKIYKGPAAGEILIKNQLAGIARMAEAGVKIKVNTVLVPGLNGEHVAAVAEAAAEAGASLHNIIPLAPQHELKHLPEPGCAELAKAREAASQYIEPFLHCQRCRADAVGVPGKCNFSHQVYVAGFQATETFSHG